MPACVAMPTPCPSPRRAPDVRADSTAPSFSPLYQQIKALLVRACRPASGSPARPSPARWTWRRASRSARARCARPSTNWRPRTCSCAARARAPSWPPTPSATQYRFLRLMPDDGAATRRLQRRLLDCRRMRAPAEVARLLGLKAARPRCRCAACCWPAAASPAPGGAGRPDLAARCAVQGPDAERLAAWRGPMYGCSRPSSACA
jgi:GntR family transcriptional regulator